MVEPLSVFSLSVSALVKSAPHWLHALEITTLTQGKQLAQSKGKQVLDKRKHLQHLRLALGNAAQRGVIRFQTPKERDEYRAIIQFLAQEGPNSEALIGEAMNLLTLSGTPDLDMLSDKYNLRERIRSLAKNTEYENIDAAPYLNSFFEEFRNELFADDIFKQQLSNVLMVRSNLSIQDSLDAIATTSMAIKDAVSNNYSEVQFDQDLQTYVEYVARSLRYLKMVGIVPKDQGRDPELEGIFVPLRINFKDSDNLNKTIETATLLEALEKCPQITLLGGPGSGKSTALKYLAWVHATSRLPGQSPPPFTLLSGNPIPLRIELRRLSEERRRKNSNITLLSFIETQLQIEGVEIDIQMFKKLLSEKNMLLLFDGLDEVATLDERKQLVEEIEGLAGSYPGNRIIVTSRPVGYELARLSNQLFTDAEAQSFDDHQIRQFLERWYIYVLHLSPIPHDDQQELEELFKTLKENSRLHRLAENPLLLTVITPLHRYERLPDKRVQVYDRCAEILLETWSKLRGTKERWKDIQLSKEDQFACVAFLGYVLHERSQEQGDEESDHKTTRSRTSKALTTDTATDVPSKFILKQIKRFLHERNLILDIKAQNIEAERFLELIQIEAGLIVERGTNEYNENLYGFVHRTFQEYFAAADVYERYQQEVDLNIVCDFLTQHLYDPHWYEVILLLLGKLKRKPLTIILNQILDDKIDCLRGKYQDILLQNLFFVCDCLVEEMSVENELAEIIFGRLSNLIKSSYFRSQRQEATTYLSEIIQTRQYASQAEAVLTALIANVNDINIKIDIANFIWENTTSKTKALKLAAQTLLAIARNTDLPIDQRINAARQLVYEDKKLAAVQQQAAEILLEIVQESSLPVETRIEATWPLLYYPSNKVAALKHQAAEILLELARNTDLPIDQRIDAATSLNNIGLLKRYYHSAAEILLDIAQSTDLPMEQRIMTLGILSMDEEPKIMRQKAVQLLLDIAQRTDVPTDQRIMAARYFIRPRSRHQKLERKAAQILLGIAQRTDMPTDQRITAARCFSSMHQLREQNQQAAQILLEIAEDPGLSIEQRIDAAQALSCFSNSSEQKQQAVQFLFDIIQNPRFQIDQRLRAASRFIQTDLNNVINHIDSRRIRATSIALDLLDSNSIANYFNEYWKEEEDISFYPSDIEVSNVTDLIKAIRHESLPISVRNNCCEVLATMIPQFDKISS
jgi:ethanolamine utilization protein EutP (predicted NTPase)